jgi:hypothetical protein
MMRSPLYYAMGRGFDADAGGGAELQTDVMRFMAILSLCLVAIFALVQSLPLGPRPEPPKTAELQRAIVASVPVKTVAARAPPAKTDSARPAPVEPLAEEVLPKIPEATARQAPQPVRQEPAEPVEAGQKGFTLRFANDAALERLISRNDVGFYAIAADKSLRLSIEGRKLNFWAASTPAQYHEMDGATVPADVQRALLRSGTALADNYQWGVTLPLRTAEQLDHFLGTANGGTLIIGDDGTLRLEP